jgi:hypothetical protein
LILQLVIRNFPEIFLWLISTIAGHDFNAVSHVFRVCYNKHHFLVLAQDSLNFSEQVGQFGFKVKAWIEEISDPGYLDPKLHWKIRAWTSDFQANALVCRKMEWAQLLARDGELLL